MSRHPTPALFLALSCCGAMALAQAPKTITSTAQAPRAEAARSDPAVLQALQANPITAPYRITATLSNNGQLVLAGRVGTKQIHDAAIQTVLAVTATPIRDDLVIDTLEAHRVAAQAAAAGAMGQAGPGLRAGVPGLAAMPYTLGNMPYVYPPPLFGRLDDPFFGFEPPLLSYAPWWRATSYRMAALAPPMTAPVNAGAPAGGLPPVAEDPAAARAVSPAPATDLPAGTIEMTLNSQGVAVLRGTVPSLADRIAVGQKIAQQPGISEVINLLKVGPVAVAAPAAAPAPAGAAVPPPPIPAAPVPATPVPAAKPPAAPAPADKPAPAPDKPVPGRALTVDAGELSPRIIDAIARRPALADQPIRVTVRDGMASLTGSVPTVYEAMIAFRALQQMPGIREVIDRLEFAMPDDEHRNPLVSKGRPEDVEPYLEAQLRRELGDLAHVDSVRLRGDTLDVRGTLAREEDRPRLDATLRSMPILRGFRVAPAFTVD